MNSWRWRTGLVYLILGVVLFSASALLFGNEEKKRGDLPNGTEVIRQGIEEKKQSVYSPVEGKNQIGNEAQQRIELNKNTDEVEEVRNAKSAQEIQAVKEVSAESKLMTEEERMKSELALVGIKLAESPSNRVQDGDSNSKGVIFKGSTSQTGDGKNINNFPSPVQGTPIKKAGNYYSESLQAYLFHAGTDYAQSEGAVIRVKHSGKVIYAGPDPILGQKVEIDCGEDWSVIYGGLENLRVKEGDQVEVNQALGQVGYYPSADGVKDQPQLHFEVWHGDEVQVP